MRDARINQVYEGANGVQAMDLVGRKLGRKGGAAPMALFDAADRLDRARTRKTKSLSHLRQGREARHRNLAGRDHVAGGERPQESQ